MIPNVLGVLMSRPGGPKFGWLSRLKDSTRNSKYRSPFILKRLESDASMLLYPGASAMPMPQLPNVPSAGTWNALMSSHFVSDGAFGSDVMLWLDGTGVPTQLGHSALRVACSARRLEFWTVIGKPVRACRMADIFQPPRNASVTSPQEPPHFRPLPNGRS